MEERGVCEYAHFFLHCKSEDFLTTDKRLGNCYLEVDSRGICSNVIGSDVYKASCCCSFGQGWGEVPGRCEACPLNGTGNIEHSSKQSGNIECSTEHVI